MKRDSCLRAIRPSAAIVACYLAAAFGARAQSYSIDWFTYDGGSGMSAGGSNSVSGTIGQPDAGLAMGDGRFSLTGGFWSLLAVQTLGAPCLTISLTSTNTVMVSWPFPSTDFGLQQNTDLTTTNWTATSETVADNGANKFIIVNPPTGNRYYRLFKP